MFLWCYLYVCAVCDLHCELCELYTVLTACMCVLCVKQNQEVRLFDKGEMNTYWDELWFVGVVSTHTCALLSDLGEATHDLGFQRLIHTHLTKACTELEASLALLEGASPGTPFLQGDYPSVMVGVGRATRTMDCLTPWIVSSEHSGDTSVPDVETLQRRVHSVRQAVTSVAEDM